jgi:inhibitor of KinA
VAHPFSSYSIFPLGDSAITIDLGNCIDEHCNIKAIAIHDWLLERPFPGRLDILTAYSSVTVLYDPARVVAGGVNGPGGVYSWLEALLKRAWSEATEPVPDPEAAGETRIIDIPVCYEGEHAPDLQRVAAQKGLSPEEVIGLHTAEVYRVYMIGFLPGFPYMGRIDARLSLPRKSEPAPVRAGGIGIVGLQTGIYPMNSPGGWWIIGRTPVQLFDAAADPPVWLKAGERVRFHAISSTVFRKLSIC